ncbi:MAG: dihydrolipoamide acetyltransferase family protein, partial [Thermoanaerobaculia bacterium]
PQAAAKPEPAAPAAEPAAQPAEKPPAAPPAEAPSETVSAADEELADRVRRASSPVVRKIAAEEGVNLSEVEGTGIHGRVTKADIQGYLQKREEPAAAAAPPAVREEAVRPVAPARSPLEFSVAPYTEGENVDIEPMSRIRQITAAHMAYSKTTSAHVTTVFHIDMSKVHAKREKAKAGFAKAHGTKLTYMPFIFKAVAAALREHRKLNAAIDGANIVYKRDINLGMAVALDWGLLVPVIRNADQLNLVGLTKTANDLADRARGKKLKPEEIQGGTFTITNPGVFGSLFGTPIINQPQVGILGIGTIEKRPVVVQDTEGNDTIAIKTMSYFGITYDHRLVDGADADHFMNDVIKGLLEDSWSELDPYL